MVTLLNRLDILSTLGQGTFGRVYRAYDHVLNREVAVKEFFNLVEKGGNLSFEKEMEFMARLDHPALVKVFDLLLDESSGTHYLTQELVLGQPCREYLSIASWDARLEVFVQILQGLEYLHRHGIVHLDIKPSNILIHPPNADGGKAQAKILDFGIAEDAARFSQKGLLAGTFPYIAPEIVRSEPVDGRADLYSLGMMFFILASAHRDPVPGKQDGASHSEQDLKAQIQETLSRPAPPSDAFSDDIPDFFRDILIALLQPSPRRRFWSANDVIRRINAHTSNRFRLEPGRMRLPDRSTAILAGRTDEFNTLCSWFREFEDTNPPLYVGALIGDPAMGKGILLDEFRRWAELRDRHVVNLSGEEDGVAELFRQLIGTGDVQDLEPCAPYLKALLPGRFPQAPDPPELEISPDLERARMNEEWSRALGILLRRRQCPSMPPSVATDGGRTDGSLPGRRPTVLLVDNVDRKTELCDLLAYLIGNPPDESETDSEAATHLFLLVSASKEQNLPVSFLVDRSLRFQNWDAGAVETVVKSLLAIERVPAKLIRVLMEQTAGKPGHLVDWLRAITEKILHPSEDLEGQLDSMDWGEAGKAFSVSATHDEEIGQLSRSERAILEWLAVCRSELTVEDLDLLDPMLSGKAPDHLRRFRQLGWVSQGSRGFRVSGQARREAVERLMEDGRKKSLHLRLAETWERLSFTRAETESAEQGTSLDLAREYFLGGEPAKGLALARSELQILLKLNQPEPVIRFLKEHQDAAGNLPARERADYMKLLGHAYLGAADYPAAIRTYEGLPASDPGSEEGVDLATRLAKAYRFGGQLAEAVDVIRKTRDALPEGSDRIPTFEALQSDILVEKANYDEAARICEPYLSGKRPASPDQLMAFRHVRAKFELYRRDYPAAIDLLEKNCAESRRTGRMARQALSLNTLGAAYLGQGDVTEAVKLLHTSSTISQEIGDLRGIALANVNLGVAYHKENDLDAATQHYQKAVAVFRRISDQANEARSLYNLAMLRTLMGDLNAGRDLLEQGLGLSNRLGMKDLEAGFKLELADVLRRLGELDRAARVSAEAETSFRELGHEHDVLSARMTGAEVCHDAGSILEARAILDDCREAVRRWGSPNLEARLLYLLARCNRPVDPVRSKDQLARAAALLDPFPNKDLSLLDKIRQELLGGGHGWPAPEAANSGQEGRLKLRERGGDEPNPKENDMALKTNPSEIVAPEASEEATVPSRSSPLPSPSGASVPSRGPLLRRRTDAETINILDVVSKINSAVDVEDVLVQIVDSMLAFTDAERAFLLLMEKGELQVRVARTREKRDIREPAENFSLTVAQEVMEKRAPVLTLDAKADPRFRDSASVYQLQLQSVAAVPLFARTEPLGVLYLDTQLKTGRFGDQDVPLLSALSGLAALAIYKAQLMAQNIRDQRELRKTVQELKESKRKVEESSERIEALNRELQAANEKLREQVSSQEIQLAEAQEQIAMLAKEEQPKYRYDKIVGSSPAVKNVLLMVDRAVESRVPVLIFGESGTGKELLARAIHYNSARKEKPFVAVNCGAIPQDLFESELFGHVKGAFTGADRDKPGLFETAQGGTLFLDEIGETPLHLQVKLLRTLQDGVIRRLGGTREIQVDVRILSATNQDLKALVAEKKFRGDLYYRIGVFQIPVPPLRDRRADLPALASHFLEAIAAEDRKTAKTLSKGALSILTAYKWPGNVRELENTLRNACVLSRSDEIIPEDFKQKSEMFAEPASGRVAPSAGSRKLRVALREIKKQLIRDALVEAGGNITSAADILGVNRSQLSIWIKKLKIQTR